MNFVIYLRNIDSQILLSFFFNLKLKIANVNLNKSDRYSIALFKTGYIYLLCLVYFRQRELLITGNYLLDLII
jgi:hypothetical protein